jgi:Ser/Thr protein kinase RdoA (MazF antagonist)
MIPYGQLTLRGQVGRLRRLAQRALPHYGLDNARLSLIQHSENTTFLVQAPADDASTPAPYTPGRYLLRIHGAGRHGAALPSLVAIQSELLWLDALRQETALTVPAPLSTADGALAVELATPELPRPRVCSILRWLDGRRMTETARPRHFHQLGQLMAQLHNHAAAWSPPAHFRRMRWDWDAFFGDGIGFAGCSAAEAWALVPDAMRPLLELVAERAADAMRALGHDREVFGLIHTDLHLDNVIFARGQAQPIDFDDCGFGYWIYDMAVALWEERLKPDFEAKRAAFFAGYALHRPVPTEQLIYLDLFTATRDVAISLWMCAMAQQNPSFRQHLAEDLAVEGTTIRRVLGL